MFRFSKYQLFGEYSELIEEIQKLMTKSIQAETGKVAFSSLFSSVYATTSHPSAQQDLEQKLGQAFERAAGAETQSSRSNFYNSSQAWQQTLYQERENKVFLALFFVPHLSCLTALDHQPQPEDVGAAKPDSNRVQPSQDCQEELDEPCSEVRRRQLKSGKWWFCFWDRLPSPNFFYRKLERRRN